MLAFIAAFVKITSPSWRAVTRRDDSERPWAIVLAIGVMYVAAEPVASFIERHPTTKMLALSFLMLVGVALVADGLHFHIPRGYIYFAMAFAIATEFFNIMAIRRKRLGRKMLVDKGDRHIADKL